MLKFDFGEVWALIGQGGWCDEGVGAELCGDEGLVGVGEANEAIGEGCMVELSSGEVVWFALLVDQEVAGGGGCSGCCDG